MVKLSLEDYCDKCPNFEAGTRHYQNILAFGIEHEFIIFCRYEERCRALYNYLQEGNNSNLG